MLCGVFGSPVVTGAVSVMVAFLLAWLLVLGDAAGEVDAAGEEVPP